MAHARWSQIHSLVQYLAIITDKFLRHAVGVPRAKNHPEEKRVEQARSTDPAYHRDISLFFQEKNVQVRPTCRKIYRLGELRSNRRTWRGHKFKRASPLSAEPPKSLT
jgi:hypothetical protein